MGKEAQVQAVFADGPDAGRLQYEPPKLIFRGRARRVFEGPALAQARADGAELVLACGARFALGERQAASWAEAVRSPKSRMQKIGVKPGMRVGLLGVDDSTLADELAVAGATLVEGDALDLLFYAADSADDLSRVGALLPRLAERGALWVVSTKGRAATVRDVEVMAAAKAHGLVDNKVVGFSATHTALRFVRRRT
jgi:hypothetical protein